MATNSVGEGKEVVSASVPVALAREIERRAKVLKWTKSKYAGELLARWYQEGCPPVSAAEVVLLEQQLFGREEKKPYVTKSSKKQAG